MGCGVTDLDLAALGLDLQSLVEVRDHAEAAAAVLDERDGIPPPALRVLRRVLRRHLESLQELHRLVPEVRHDRSIGAGELWINRSLPVNCSHVSGSAPPTLQTSLPVLNGRALLDLPSFVLDCYWKWTRHGSWLLLRGPARRGIRRNDRERSCRFDGIRGVTTSRLHLSKSPPSHASRTNIAMPTYCFTSFLFVCVYI
jgi:hypothetical protein